MQQRACARMITMEISLVKKRVLDTIDAAKKAAADRRSRADEAGKTYAQFLEQIAVPVLRQIANVLRAEGHAFTVFTPSGGARLTSDRAGDDYIELSLDTTGPEPRVIGHTRRARGRRVIEAERAIADRAPSEITEEDVLGFVLRELGPYVDR
jgi:hypothetical protein